MKDPRIVLYNDLHDVQLSKSNEQNKHSAKTILEILFEYYKPTSILDVGCGLSTWLSIARELGITNLQGVEGPWVKNDGTFITHDLNTPLVLNKKFGLVISLEVAEHLEQQYAEQFIDSLIRHGDVILFSAAIPYQGGHGHINEQFLSYWNSIFNARGFIAVDCIRNKIWTDPSILWFLRQNIILYVNKNIAASFPTIATPLSIIHPDVYLSRLQGAVETIKKAQLMYNLLATGGTFTVQVDENKGIILNKVN